jgi:hypothetical protein
MIPLVLFALIVGWSAGVIFTRRKIIESDREIWRLGSEAGWRAAERWHNNPTARRR